MPEESFNLSPSIEAGRSHARSQYLASLTQIRRYNPAAQIQEVRGMLARLAILIPEWPVARQLAALSFSEARNPSTQQTPIQLPTISNFLASLGQAPEPLVPGIIPDHSLILLAGKPKHGKSLLALEFLHCLAQGIPVFGAFPCKRSGPVLYLGMEDGPFEIAGRFRARRIPTSIPLHVGSERLPLYHPAVMEQLTGWAQSVKPVLIVVDTAREACGIKDWSNPAEVTDKIRPFRKLAREHCTVILVTHNRKTDGDNGDEISGSNALTSSVDGWISIYDRETQPNGDLLIQARVEGRGGMRGSLALLMDARTLHFRVPPPPASPTTGAEMSEDFRGVIDAIDVAGGQATVEQIALVIDSSKTATYRLIQQMQLAHLIHVVAKRQTSGRSIRLYARTPPANSPGTMPQSRPDPSKGNMRYTRVTTE